MFSNTFIPNKRNGFYPYSIRKPALGAYVLVLFLLNLFGSFLIPGFATEVSASTITAANIISLTNAERQAHSLNALSSDARLASAAQAKANDMFEKDYWDHFGPNGETPWQFITGAGYSYVYAGENLAKGFSTAEGVHQAWMASPTHKANIVNGNYRDIGVAVVEGELAGENVILVVQMFGSQTSEIPAPTPAPAPAPTPVVSETEPAPTPLPQEEKGEIKSISIVRPAVDSVVTDASTNIEGSVEGYESNIGAYTVVVSRDDENIGSTDATSETWLFDKDSDWQEGEQKISVHLKDNESLTDSVVFTLDSKAPMVNEESVSILLDGNHAEVNVVLAEEDAEVYVNVGSETYAFTHEGEGVYTAYIPESVVTDGSVQGVLIVSDLHGNLKELDLTEQMANALNSGNLDPVTQPTLLQKVLSGFTSMSMKGKLNLAFGILLLTLLVAEVLFLIKKKKLKEKGGYLMTAGVFFFIVLVGLFTEVSGNIS